MLFVMNTLFAATCADGYNAINIVSTDIDFGGGCANNSYTRYDTPDFDLYYIIPDAVTSRYTQGECDSDEYTVPTTLTMGQIGGKCPASYEQLYAAIERGISVIPDDVPDFDRGECPTGYYDATVVTGLNLSPLNEGLCSSGYTTYEFDDICRNSDSYICPLLCQDGGEYTDLGTCGSFCTAFDANLLHFGNKAARLWSTKQNVVNKSINIGAADGTVCYVNLVAGEKTGTLNVRYDNATYHVVDLVETGENQ